MVQNNNKLTIKMWKSFKSDLAKNVFNETFESTINNQASLIHPKQEILPQEQWNTICHNIACIAAWSIDKTKL